MLVGVDATDPSASGNAISALGSIAGLALAPDLKGAIAGLNARDAPFELRIHRRYNPEGLSSHNIVPGLIGTILTMTMVMLTGLAVGFTFSTLAQDQLQAMQMTFFFFLPSMLLSGFMFPFRGMPH